MQRMRYSEAASSCALIIMPRQTAVIAQTAAAPIRLMMQLAHRDHRDGCSA
jgi:hypothetical protein